jgi:hypothetical protein
MRWPGLLPNSSSVNHQEIVQKASKEPGNMVMRDQLVRAFSSVPNERRRTITSLNTMEESCL